MNEISPPHHNQWAFHLKLEFCRRCHGADRFHGQTEAVPEIPSKPEFSQLYSIQTTATPAFFLLHSSLNCADGCVPAPAGMFTVNQPCSTLRCSSRPSCCPWLADSTPAAQRYRIKRPGTKRDHELGSALTTPRAPESPKAAFDRKMVKTKSVRASNQLLH